MIETGEIFQKHLEYKKNKGIVALKIQIVNSNLGKRQILKLYLTELNGKRHRHNISPDICYTNPKVTENGKSNK